jgi:hypothetical protein
MIVATLTLRDKLADRLSGCVFRWILKSIVMDLVLFNLVLMNSVISVASGNILAHARCRRHATKVLFVGYLTPARQ